MQQLIEYLKENRIKHTRITDFKIEISGEEYNMVYLNEEGKLFTEDFILITDVLEGKYVFKFGGKYYYCDNAEKPELNPLKYLGAAELSFEPTAMLGLHGKYDLLSGSRQYSDWCKKAKFLEIDTLGLCEKNTLAGTLSFQLECEKNGIKSILGATYTIDRNDYKYDTKVYVKNAEGWKSILRLNKLCKIDNQHFIPEKDFIVNMEGLHVILDPKSIDYDKILPLQLNGVKYYQLDTVEYVSNDRDKWYLENLKKFVEGKNSDDLEPVLITDAYYLDKEDSPIKKKLNLISGKLEYEAVNQYFKPVDDWLQELMSLFNDTDERFEKIAQRAIDNLKEISGSCNFEIEVGKKHLPKYIRNKQEQEDFESNEDLFWHLIEKGLSEKCPKGQESKYLERIEKEYEVISYGGLVDYFLINWDQVKWSQENNIYVGLSRGSACGSLISFLLNITKINPFDYDLIFERFLTKSRAKGKIADIDIDNEQLRRDEIKEYHKQKYGDSQCCSAGTYTTLKLKGALKDLCRLYNVDFATSNRLSKYFSDEDESWSDFIKLGVINPFVGNFIKKYPQLVNELQCVLGGLKSVSIHASAFIIVPDNKTIYEYMPLRKEGGNLISEWEGVELEDVGMLKQDLLGLKTLDKYHHIVNSIEEQNGENIDIYNVPLDDKKVFKYFSNGWNCDIFQFGSKGLSGFTKDLKPDNIDDVIATVALYRPGAIENNFHNDYILIKNGKKEPEYLWGTEEITKNTFSIPIYQEQIMFMCQKLGKFNLDETDEIRRALGKKKIDVLLEYKDKFIDTAIEQGCPKGEAIDIWSKLEKYAKYSFNLSHSVAYGITGYIGQWLKVNYPIHFWTTAFTFASEDDIPKYISEINQTGDIKVTPPNINISERNFKTDFKSNAIAWSLSAIKQVGEKAVEEIIQLRDEKGEYFSFEEFYTRHDFKGSKVNKSVVENLILSGAFDSIEGIKRPVERKRLIDQYRKLAKVKIKELENDWYLSEEDVWDQQWFWQLQQKKLSGFAIFDYEGLLELAIESDKFEYIKPEEFQTEGVQGKDVKVGGYVSELTLRTSKKIGEYCQLLIESNYEFLHITIWNDAWEVLRELLEESEKKLILISGRMQYDSYKKQNVLQTTEDTECVILE